jgi:class 3 adenylate cyclase
MYTKFRELLRTAEGRNEWVAAINADIRGFSTVMSGDPAQTALYLRAVYGRILDDFFHDRSFFKPTGDGLLIVVPFSANEAELARVTESVVADALQLHDTFPEMIAEDKLIRFPHPKEVGIGLAVGSVSRLVKGNLTLDYTGRALNVATRLMDLARPSGVVLDSTLDFSALGPLKKRFASDHVYLKGVADQDGVDILYTSNATRIPERYRKPLRPATRFEEKPDYFTREDGAKRGNWHMRLTREPADRTQLEVLVHHTKYQSGKALKIESWFRPKFEYVLHSGKPHISIDFPELVQTLAKRGVPPRKDVYLTVAYPIEPDPEHDTDA